MAWRVQNHAMDLCLPGGQNTLILNINATKGNTMRTQIPRQISRDELIKILPDSWITNYEKLREPEESLQSGEPTFTKRNDKTIHTLNMMENFVGIYTASWKNKTGVKILTKKEKELGGSNAPLRDTALGILIATVKTVWKIQLENMMNTTSVIGKEKFTPSWEDSETTPKPKSPSTHIPESKKPPEPETSPTQKIINPTQPQIFMLSPSSSSHTQDFPSLQLFEKEGISHAPKISKKNIVLPTGEKPPTSDIEATMNWQSENSICQNKVLNNIGNTIKNVDYTQNKMISKVETIEKKMERTSSHHARLIKALELRLENLQYEICPPGTSLFQFFQQQQKETISIKEQIQLLRHDHFEPQKIPVFPSKPTFFPMSPQAYSPPKLDYTVSTFPSTSQNPISFTQPLKEEHDFDIAKIVWERKDVLAAQKQTKKRRDQGESSKGTNPKNLIISDQKALDLYVSQPRYISKEDTPWSKSLNSSDDETMEDNSQSSNESTTNSSEDDNALLFANQPRDPEVSEID
uniref:Uncharacterized protein LOC104230095 n=1 Tax=Nicotiana sylvestris TaxID=4096 RepID=A0A1U7WRC3_NICSY|nr:PREDICTED: uncharacterized protein LOC104230095 [Nicotiana sylvestris]